MPKKPLFISPISIDLGAKNTGVYFAHYPAGISLLTDSKQLKKSGKVYQLDKNSYTLLMTNRTAKRHQKRGYDRRQMVKRLFKLIWEQHFGLVWDKDVQQTISFLLNRRGFTFLTEEYDTEILSQFPEVAYDLLPLQLKKDVEQNEDGSYNFNVALQEWTKNTDKIKLLYQEFKYKVYLEKIRNVCNKIIVGDNSKPSRDDLSKVDTSVVDKMKKEGIKGWDKLSGKYEYTNKEGDKKELPFIYGNNINIRCYLRYNTAKAKEISDSLPAKDNTKEDIWSFVPELFKIEQAKEKGAFDLSVGESHKKAYIKTHLHHLAYALYKTNNELQSGGRHRSRYFEEVESVLNCDSHDHGYLKRFCKKLKNGGFSQSSAVFSSSSAEINKKSAINNSNSLNRKTLYNLICHLSNFELKPLRKYFNDKNHKKTDYWHEDRLAQIFGKWISTEWRVNPQKDKDKAEGGSGDYKQLKDKWREWKKQHKEKKVISFWLETKPHYTIPPYQDNNNRRPPKCQSFVFNPVYLDSHYPDWEKWLDTLKSQEQMESYLADYEEQLKHLKSSGNSAIDDRSCQAHHSHQSGNPNIESNGKFSYFSDSIFNQQKNKKHTYQKGKEHLKARVLQFIFDRVKDNDPFNLNEIYSHAKKYRQHQSTNKEKEEAKEKLEETVKKSILPEALKTDREYTDNSVFPEKSFLHLVCKYYKLRQRAKDGRIFIHPKYRYSKQRGCYERTSHFEDTNCLLTYCNYKPRQKRYQTLEDLAGLLQVSPKQLKAHIRENHNQSTLDMQEKTDDELVTCWLTKISGLKTNCDIAAKEQKNRRGRLRLDIQTVYGLIDHKTKKEALSKEDGRQKNKQIKDLLKRSSIKEAYKLYNHCEKAKELYLKITEGLYNDIMGKQRGGDIKKNPATAVYFLAQINNIVFKERSGNAKTCAVCSMDNAQRMQTLVEEEEAQGIRAKAQRLPAISTRIIDGAVMKMAKIIGGAIAKDKWENIKSELEKGHTVRIPIITESNRFEFEPDLKILKNKPLSKEDRDYRDINILKDKDERIKTAGQGICPYTDEEISKDSGETDHIIPRSDDYGVLNDEANLIWTSYRGNKEVKKNNTFGLANLKPAYKQKQFNTTDDTEIAKWIIKQIGNEEGENFEFGPYRSFINLEPDQQKAFRHALFLVDHPLRAKVLNAIDNRTRTFVNGTQRYFAEMLANKLYIMAKKEGKEHLLSFDYFGIEAWDSSRGNGVKDLRKELKKYYRTDLKQFDKANDSSSQPLYSHLLDAQVAFCMALCAHQKDGVFNIDLKKDKLGLWSRVDRETGEMLKDKETESTMPYDATLFNKISIPADELNLRALNRLKPHPKKKNIFHRPIFNDNAVAMHFLKLIKIELKEKRECIYFKGFLATNELKKCLQQSDDDFLKGYEKYAKKILPEKYLKDIQDLYYNRFKIVKNGRLGTVVIKNFGSYKSNVTVYNLNKKMVYNFLINNFNSALPDLNNEHLPILKILSDLWYFTKKENVLKMQNQENIFNKPKAEKLKCAGFVNPQLKYKWEMLEKTINKGDTNAELSGIVRKFFLKNNKHEHQKARTVFSLPVSSQRAFLIKRRNWQDQSVFYCRPASNDFSQTVLHTDGNRQLHTQKDERLSNIYRKNNIFYVAKDMNKLEKQMQSVSVGLSIDPNKYYEAEIPVDFQEYIQKIENKRTDESRPLFRFSLCSKKMPFEKFIAFIKQYPFRRLQDLKADYRKEYIDELDNSKKLKDFIEQIKSMDKNRRPKNVLPTLTEFNQFWRDSQNKEIIEYSAKYRFTLK